MNKAQLAKEVELRKDVLDLIQKHAGAKGSVIETSTVCAGIAGYAIAAVHAIAKSNDVDDPDLMIMGLSAQIVKMVLDGGIKPCDLN